MKLSYSLPNITALLSFTYIYVSFNPFPMWVLPGFVIFILLGLSLTACTYLLAVNNKLIITRKRIFFAIILFAFMLHLALPLFGHPPLVFKIFQFFPLLLITFFSNKIYYDIFRYFRLLFIVISGYSIVVFFLLFIGLDLPYYRVDGFTMVTQYNNDFYRVYGLAVSSTNTVYNVYGFTIARLMGPFQEAGHFAIYLGIILSIEKILYDKISKVLVIAGFLTFSPAFLVIFALIMSYDLIIRKRIKLLIGSAVFISIIFLVVLTDPAAQETLYYLTIGRNFEGIELSNVLDDRTGGYALMAYTQLAQTSQVFMGKGLGSTESIGMLADYRGLIFKIGLFGTILSIILFFILFVNENKKILFLLVPIILLVLAHRSWMFEGPYLYALILLAINSFKYKNANRKKSLNHSKLFQLNKYVFLRAR